VNQPWVVGADWDTQRFRQLGWRLMPLRLFLSVTFIYASLQKLANPTYFDPSSPSSVVGQMRALESTSPIAPLLRVSLHAPTLVGLLIALGELAAGVGLLVGLWTRLAAIGGAVLSLSFFLTVSWSTTPYFYGSDIVFATCGAAGVASLDGWVGSRARSGKPLDRQSPLAWRQEIDRRTILLGARAAGAIAAVSGLAGVLTAVIGRAVGGTKTGAGAHLNAAGRHPLGQPHSTKSTQSTQPTHSAAPHQPAPGTALAHTRQVPAGSAARFTDPATGRPAWIIHDTSGNFSAFSAVCTHAGCTVNYDSSSKEFVCPCHGGSFSATTGKVLGGPPPSPLRAIPVHVVHNEIRVD
jgi:thiosulfate dehydrogenase [quinone] large subunit